MFTQLNMMVFGAVGFVLLILLAFVLMIMVGKYEGVRKVFNKL